MSIVVVPPPTTAEVLPNPGMERATVVQGFFGTWLRNKFKHIDRDSTLHWFEVEDEDYDNEFLDELNNYQQVPFERVGSIRVRFVRINELKPRKIEMDEFDEGDEDSL